MTHPRFQMHVTEFIYWYDPTGRLFHTGRGEKKRPAPEGPGLVCDAEVRFSDFHDLLFLLRQESIDVFDVPIG
jgi:hypothetical protein